MKNTRHRIFYVLPVSALLALWAWLVPENSRAAFLLGTPAEIGRAAAELIGDPLFWRDLSTSVGVLLGGYLLGAVLGFSIGLLGWTGGRLRQVFEAHLVALGSIPLFALAPLLIFFFGIGTGTRLIIVTFSVGIPLALAAIFAARDTERHYRDVLLAFPAPRSRALAMIVAPGTFYACLPALKPAGNSALVAVFLSEWISAERGLAKFVLASMSTYKVPQMWVGLLTFMLLGILLGVTVDLIERRLTRWRVS
jgi:NitT/TauT family transport system permease protein